MSDPVADAKTRIREISVADAMSELGGTTFFLDCREQNEWNLVHIPGATLLPLGQIDSRVEGVVDKDRRVIVYCARGNRSAIGADIMQNKGYTNVVSMAGGIRDWVDEGGDTD
jgi:rhodanese-related sulfurtransferase